MAGKSASMSRIKQVLQLSENGVSNRQIAKDLGINKETVNIITFIQQTLHSHSRFMFSLCFPDLNEKSTHISVSA
jgi:DNA-binding NarL/FixJ family response regulator